ncbi:MAG: hypothetical protein HQK82_15005, partial [Desulfovibrionaceae bacterium]|nr:hypothetical protein [Desulfovibrionaceae bacterium]
MDIVNGQAAVLVSGEAPGEAGRAGCLDAIGEFGQYSQAAVVYSGLVAGSLLNRSAAAVAGGVAQSAAAIAHAGEYSLAWV